MKSQLNTVGARGFTSISKPARVLLSGAAAAHLRERLSVALPPQTRWDIAECGRAAASLSRNVKHDVAVMDASESAERIARVCAMLRHANDAVSILLVDNTSTTAVLQLALRVGAHSVISLPMSGTDIEERVGAALDVAMANRLRREKLLLLESLCDRLAQDRDELSERLGGVCGDLASAWEQFEERSSVISRVGEFRALLSQELEIDDVVRTAMQYLLRVVGPTNIAVFTRNASAWKLAGYAKEDTPRPSAAQLLSQLIEEWCPALAESAGVVLGVGNEAANAEANRFVEVLGGRSGLAFCGRHEGSPEVIVVCFRRADRPFDRASVASVEALRDIFADAVERMGRILHRAQPSWPSGSPDSVDTD
ncbi:MAG: hypothetical protein EXS00_00565 [Phycisphaerales bacterium]|nr:hypothetical protein [Phycisphaerales bacterium]